MSVDQNEVHPQPDIVLVHGAWVEGSSWTSACESCCNGDGDISGS